MDFQKTKKVLLFDKGLWTAPRHDLEKKQKKNMSDYEKKKHWWYFTELMVADIHHINGFN